MDRIKYVTMTYCRPELLEDLQKSIEREHQDGDSWLVWDDATPAKQRYDYSNLPDYADVIISDMNRGKVLHWKQWMEVMQVLKNTQDDWDVVVVIPDDAVLAKGARESILSDLGSKVLLSLHNDQPERLSKNNWGRVPKEKRKFYHDGFIDMLFAARPAWFKAMDWMMTSIRRSWRVQPKLGSGVGAQLTKRTRAADIDILIGKGDYVSRRFDVRSQMNHHD